ncbi:MAG TPA: ABC transporter permease subunit [Candidatus Limiplasma sp.]|nr:ABC transporter permease subunit [Candidatus Limiplasma sp.]HRX09657.1 ABC transporter permease subunit [Candidatus Limiplasma sp.]
MKPFSVKKLRSIKLWAVLFWLLIWQLGSVALGKEILLVSPLRVIVELYRLAQTGAFWQSILHSLSRIAAGFGLALAAGILLAALAARFHWVDELLKPLVSTIKSIPVASFIILVLIWFPSDRLSIVIAFLMVMPILYTSVLAGIRATDISLKEMAAVFRLSPVRMIRYIYIPQAMPFFVSGCTVALGLCWKAGIAAEVIGMPHGSIGEQLQQAKVYLATPELFAWTLVIVLVSLAFEKAVLFLIRQTADLLKKV